MKGGDVIIASSVEKKKWLPLLLLFLLLVGAIYFFFLRSEPGSFMAGDMLPDGRDAEGRNMSDLAQELVDASYVTVQINLYPEFEYEGAEGDIGIVNPAVNVFPIAVDIVLDETQEVIYSSGAIFPNEQITSARLDFALPAGSHAATAVFNAYDPDSHERLWTGHFVLEITVGS